VFVHELLERQHDPRGLLRVAARAGTQEVVGRAQVEVAEEDVVHRLVVVLSGVDELGVDVALVERVQHRLYLDEVRPRSGDAEHAHLRPPRRWRR
jgi:hypothetical protein